MINDFTFPFGQPLRRVEQQDRAPKKVFVLGVYASAVHARWIDVAGTTTVTAVAVASEPYIFWRGEDADTIVNRIEIPSQLGTLVAAARNLNGPSGRALDAHFLDPLGIGRVDAWLCDLIPHACMNRHQRHAIERAYVPRATEFGLPAVRLPPVPATLSDPHRRSAILAEIRQAQPEVVILLGDEPIRWFLSYFDNRWKSLADVGREQHSYGQICPVILEGEAYHVLPLVHPRQAAKLGAHSSVWSELHQNWRAKHAPGLLR